jgi:RNA polymerase sigma-70 factor (ECF subfamily)
MADASDSQLLGLIQRANDGDPAARAQLIQHSADRLRRLTRKLLHDFPRVRRWEEADDVFHNALLRLLQALRSVAPASVADYFRLATRQVRRELLDLARHYYGPEGLGANHASVSPAAGRPEAPAPPIEKSDSTLDPDRLAAWTEFHRHVAALPEQERDVVELLWYHGLSQAAAAAVLQVSVPTVKRRWLSARLQLQGAFQGGAPSS